MAEIRDDQLRSLIRLIPPARALKEQLEEQIHLELSDGLGDYAVRTVQGLHASVSRLTDDDPYVASMGLSVVDDADDRKKVSLALLASSQLVAFLEGQTGLSGFGGGNAKNIQTAPHINGVAISGVSPETAGKAVNAIADMMKGKASEEG